MGWSGANAGRRRAVPGAVEPQDSAGRHRAAAAAVQTMDGAGARLQRRGAGGVQAPRRNDRRRQTEPETFDECMEEAVDLEEKAERYGGDKKARRYYERACELYALAHVLDPGDADCLYNWGRVLYFLGDLQAPGSPVLVTPAGKARHRPQKLLFLSQCLEKFRHAIRIQPENTDALFNAAQALCAQAEVLQDNDGDENAELETAALVEACALAELTFSLQEKEWLKRKAARSAAGTDPVEPAEERSSAVNGIKSIEMSTERATAPEVAAVCAASLTETLCVYSHALSSLASLVPLPPEASELHDRAVRVLERALSIATADCEGKVAEIQLQWGAVLSLRADRLAKETDGDVLYMYQEALGRIDEALTRDGSNVAALCERGDVLCSVAGLQIRKLMESPAFNQVLQARAVRTEDSEVQTGPLMATEDEALAADCFSTLSKASKAYTAALEGEPLHFSITVKLGDVNMSRARLAMLPIIQTEPLKSSGESASRAVPFAVGSVSSTYGPSVRVDGPSLVARKNLPVLLRNALTYYRRALAASPSDIDTLLRLAQALALERHLPDAGATAPGAADSSWMAVVDEWIAHGGSHPALETAGVDYVVDVFDPAFLRTVSERLGPRSGASGSIVGDTLMTEA